MSSADERERVCVFVWLRRRPLTRSLTQARLMPMFTQVKRTLASSTSGAQPQGQGAAEPKLSAQLQVVIQPIVSIVCELWRVASSTHRQLESEDTPLVSHVA